MTKNNLICVHHGTAYGPEYVLNLWKNARQNSKGGFNFYVFTDNTKQHPQDLGWHFIKLPNWDVHGMLPWWYKIEIFNQQHGLAGNNLFFDLDIIIINDIDCFWNFCPEQFRICKDFNRAFSKNTVSINSSVMAWQDNSMNWLYRKFSENMQYNVHIHRGDQDFIQEQTTKNHTWWPDEWAMSWKWEIKHGGQCTPHGKYYSVEPYIIPDETRLIICHGKPKPHEILELKQFWNK